MAKYNWNRLRLSYINGNYKSLKEFADRKKIPYKTLQASAVGWTSEKREKDREKFGKIEQEVRERQISDAISREISRNQRVLDATDKLLDVYDRLSDEDIMQLARKAPKAFVSLTAGLVNVQRVHRTAEGLDKGVAENCVSDLELTLNIRDFSQKTDDQNE